MTVPRKALRLLAIPAFVIVGYLWISPSATAADETPTNSIQVSELLSSVKVEAVELKRDAMQLDEAAQTRASWEKHAQQITTIKEHVNRAGKLLAQLHDSVEVAAPWQKKAIAEITPLLQELATNTTTIIERLNNHDRRLSELQVRDYARANFENAQELAALIGDYVSYGKAHEELSRLSRTLEVKQD